EKELNDETEKIWAFGFSGEVEFQDGKVVATSDSPLTQSDYVTILVHFPEGMFSTDDQLSKSFEDVKEEAFKDSDYETDRKSTRRVGKECRSEGGRDHEKKKEKQWQEESKKTKTKTNKE